MALRTISGRVARDKRAAKGRRGEVMAKTGVLNMDHQAVAWFADQMAAKLDLRSTKPGNAPGGWRELPGAGVSLRSALWVLQERCSEELEELRRALLDGSDPLAIISECCDVANFPMMVADLVRIYQLCPHCDGVRFNAWQDIKGVEQRQCRDCGSNWAIQNSPQGSQS